MFRNYLKVAFRNIIHHKGYAFINIAGLAIGMACAFLILLWVQDEYGFNRFHRNAKTLYRLEQTQSGPQGGFHVAAMPYPMGPALKAEIPEVQDAARWAFPGTMLVRYGEKTFFEEQIRAVDPSLLKMFTFPLVSGNADEALNQPRSIVISTEAAKKYFGSENPIGKTLLINNQYPFAVTGVLARLPAGSSLRFDMLVPFDFVKELGQYADTWGYNEILTWVQLREKSDVAAVDKKITALFRDKSDQEFSIKNPGQQKPTKIYAPEFSLMPLTDIRLYARFGFNQLVGTAQYVYMFSLIALFVLLIASINFMNLATARSANRAKEVGLRKVMGARRGQLAWQFYGESMLTTFAAAVLSLLMVFVLLPAFNELSGKEIGGAALINARFVLGAFIIALLTGLVSGSYPALFLSAFHPIRVLSGTLKAGTRGARFRQVLVVTQFTLSIALLIGTGVVYRQLDFMQHKALGYDSDRLIQLPLRGDTSKSYPALKTELLRDSRVLSVTAVHQEPTYISSNGWGASWDGKDPNLQVLVSVAVVDFDYPETMKIQMAAGRSFSRDYATDKGQAFLINEEMAKVMGMQPVQAVGKRLNYAGVDGPIVGVMKNFHYQPIENAIEPLAVLVTPDQTQFAVVRLHGGDINSSMAWVKSAWQKVNPLYPFEYAFLKDMVGKNNQTSERLGTILKYFAAMAILVGCMGLFGLASFTAEQRTKEIGVRKVLGASAGAIVLLLSREYAKWVIMANLLAWPLGYYFMKRWLQGFAYRADLTIWLFVLAGAGALAVALVTVCYQAISAAFSNPVESLRYE